MKPGRELDFMIEEQVMGPKRGWTYNRSLSVLSYSTSIRAAGRILEWFEEQGRGLNIRSFKKTAPDQLSEVWCWEIVNTYFWGAGVSLLCGWPEGPVGFTVYGETLPHALCLAALETVRLEGSTHKEGTLPYLLSTF